MNIFLSIKSRLEFVFYPQLYNYYVKKNIAPKVLNSVETLKKIYDEHLSFARFGDGEFELMWGIPLKFQSFNNSIQDDLFEVINSNSESLLIGLPNTFDGLNGYAEDSKKFWKRFMGKYYKKIVKLLPDDYFSGIYGNANATRFYTGFDSNDNEEIVELFKNIWDARNVICIEGNKTRMGIGNDLFDNCKSFKRIICPAENAYDSIKGITDWISENVEKKSNTLFLIALGPTATILAYRLANLGYQAIDLGHLDIQYEYYLRNTDGKTNINGKYVNEVSGGSTVENDILDDKYFEQILVDFRN